MIKVYLSDYCEITDKIIDLETKRKVKLVPESDGFQISTACVINDEFVLVSTYNVPREVSEKLELA